MVRHTGANNWELLLVHHLKGQRERQFPGSGSRAGKLQERAASGSCGLSWQHTATSNLQPAEMGMWEDRASLLLPPT